MNIRWLNYILNLLILSSVLTVGCKSETSLHFSGKVTGLLGDVEVFDAASQKWKPLAFGEQVKFGDSIRTLDESRLEITFNGENSFRLDTNTQVRVKRDVDSAGKELIVIHTGDGTVLSEIKGIPEGNDRYRVTTPTTVAVVKGTVFSVSHSLSIGVSHVHCFEGRVWAFNPFIPPVPPVVILPGFFTSVHFGVIPVVPVHIPPGHWKRFHGFMPLPVFTVYTKKHKVKGIDYLWGVPVVDMRGKHIKVKPGSIKVQGGGPGKIHIKDGKGSGPSLHIKGNGPKKGYAPGPSHGGKGNDKGGRGGGGGGGGGKGKKK